MGDYIHWLLDSKIILAQPTGDTTPAELKRVSDTFRAFIDKSDAPLVHILIDESQLKSMPISIKLVTDIVDVFRHPRLGWFILYGSDDQVKKFVSTMVTKVSRVRHRRFDTMDDCLNFLTMVDSSLPAIEDIMNQV